MDASRQQKSDVCAPSNGVRINSLCNAWTNGFEAKKQSFPISE
jgi:hypothetical protein